jgi:phenylalanyl-tRNA synthetase beta subunit
MLATYAMRELSATILEMCPDAVFEDIVDIYPSPVTQNHVQFSTDYINTRLGTKMSIEEISDILRLPIGTIGTRLSRGKAILKLQCLKQK